jgi:NDP-sugar pyrophosphorylase family protein
MKAVVLAGGKGTRLAPYTQILPKPLMPIGDMPILEMLLRQMKRTGIDEVILTVGHLADLLRSYFGDGSKFGVRLTYSHEECPLGTAGPLSLLSGLDDTFMVTNGDVLTTLDFAELVDWHKAHKAAATIAMHQRQVNIDFGVIQSNADHTITGYTEKPSIDYCVSMGVYVFEPRVLPFISYNQYLDFPDLVLKLIAAGETVVGFPFSGYWQDLGRPDDYAQATAEFNRMRSKFLPGGD